MTTTKPFQLGTVISGANDPAKLLPAFAECLKGFCPDHTLVNDTKESLEGALLDFQLYARNWLIDFNVEVQFYCPPFVRFGLRGPYVDDSDADYGFWPDWDALDPGLEWPLIGKYQLEECIIDRYNETTVSVYDLGGNLLWETTNETM